MVSVAAFVLGLACFAILFFAVGVAATFKHTQRKVRPLPARGLPPVSILKPLKGTEESLEANLRSFFAQDYPSFEIVFATSEASDAALPVARQVAADFPHIPTRFVLSNPNYGLNPKVANLEGALRSARYDLVLQSDANVRAEPSYLRNLVTELVNEDASLVSSLVCGTGEESMGAAMENLQLTSMIAPSCCFALHYFGVTCVIGKSMLFRKSELAAVGGLTRVKDLLAEDYILGRIYEKAGLKVVLSATQAENVNVHTPVERFFARHARWLKMRAVIHPPAFLAEFFANPVGLAAVAFALSGCDLRFFGAALAISFIKASMDGFVMAHTRRRPMALRHLAIAPLKDLVLFGILPYAAISRSIEWRGTKLRLGWGSALRPDEGMFLSPVRIMRRVWSSIAH